MLPGMLNDIQHWYNYTPFPSPAEGQRIQAIVGDADYAQQLLNFGFRPLSFLDDHPQAPSESNLAKPFQILDKHLSEDPILVDIVTGYRFRFLPDEGGLVFDLQASRNFIDAVELLNLAAHRGNEFQFEHVQIPTISLLGSVSYVARPNWTLPLNFHVTKRSELETILAKLTELFCVKCPRTTKLWLRGQRCDYSFKRSEELSTKIYGVQQQSSLLPSAGRYAFTHPDEMGFGLSFHGPNHHWKKPFLIWLMRQNAHWFKADRRALDVLTDVLKNDDEDVFSKVLLSIQMGGCGPFADLGGGVSWPDEADDLRQWFFAFMKTHSFAITLQQYGYVTSLLDLTNDVDVAIYFSQASMVDRKITKGNPQSGRLIYVFAERRTGDFYRHGEELFWGDDDWAKGLPPRLALQKAGFLMGSTSRSQNFYSNMIVAKIYLDGESIQSPLEDEDLFPARENDLLYSTLLDSRPPLEGLY